ncbi:MAG: ABC transporter substrate-binding protein [Clostridiales Family XIII bacterium]|jgi:NitT/TauT family transport system substrate-binding protein|nr:ABC transporter substrate-binding protein [Clostridiales Family XIII bacterium]
MKRTALKSKHALAFLLSALLLVSTAACGSGGNANESANEGEAAAPASVGSLTVIVPDNIVGVPLWVIAQENGYFEDEGLEVDGVTMTTGTMEALEAGKADAMLNGIIPALSYAAQGSDVKIVAGMASGGNFLIARPENVESLRDFDNWKGKRLGLVRLSTSEMITRYALEELGYNLTEDVTFVEIDSYPNIIEAVRKDQVDIGYIASEYGQSIKDLGLEVIFPLTNLVENYVCCRVSASGKTLAANRDAFVKFVKTQIRAYKFYKESPDEVVALLSDASDQTEEFVRNVVYNMETNANRSFNPEPNLNGVRNVYTTLRDWNYIEDKGIEVEDIVDIGIFNDALEEILAEYPDDPIYLELKALYEANNNA